jgi:hypothetical protein
MERTTKKITLPITQSEVEIYSYITGGEKRQLTEILTSNISADVTGQTKGDIPLSLVYQANDKAIEILVKSVSGETSEVLSLVSNLPEKDYDFVVSEINKITNNTDYQEKKTI